MSLATSPHELSVPELKTLRPTPATPTFEPADPNPNDPGHPSSNPARATGPSKVVQYAPTARNQAMKAFVGQGKPNFGDLDPRQSRTIAPPPGLTPPPGLCGIAFANNPMGYGFGNARPFTPSILRPSVAGPPPGIPAPGHTIAGAAAAGPPYPSPPNPGENRLGGLSLSQSEEDVIHRTLMHYGQWNNAPSPAHPAATHDKRGVTTSEPQTVIEDEYLDDDGYIEEDDFIDMDDGCVDDGYTNRLVEAFGKRGKEVIEILDENQKKNLVTESTKKRLSAELSGTPTTTLSGGNTAQFPYPTHGESDRAVTYELLTLAYQRMAEYVDHPNKGKGGGQTTTSTPYRKLPESEARPNWVTDDRDSLFEQSFGKSTHSKHNVAIPLGFKRVKNKGSPAIEMAAVHQFTEPPQPQPQAQAYLSAARSFSTPSQPKAQTALRPFTSAPQLQARPAPHFQGAYSYADGSQMQPTTFVSMGSSPYTGAAQTQPQTPTHQPAGPLTSSAQPRPRPQSQSFATASPPVQVYLTQETLKSPFAALEAALGTKRFTQDLPSQAPEAGIGCRGPRLVPSVLQSHVPTFGDGRPWGDELTKSDTLKRKQTPGSRFGIIMNDPAGPKFVGDYASPSGVMVPTKRAVEGSIRGEGLKLSWENDAPCGPASSENPGNGGLAGHDKRRSRNQQAARFGSQKVKNLWDDGVSDRRTK